MADHDRDAGSRGEEDAPRDPTSIDETTTAATDRDTDVYPTPPSLKYGEIPPGPDTIASPMPGGWGAHPEPRSGGFRGLLRRKTAQIMGAGMIGLFAGAVLGGGVVAVFGDLNEPRHPRWIHEEMDRGPHFLRPDQLLPPCYHGEDEMFCVLPRGEGAPRGVGPIRAE